MLENSVKGLAQPLTTLIIQDFGKNPFLILISCLLSLRSRDIITYKVCKELFARAKTPHELFFMPINELQDIIYSINYYKTKAQTIHNVCSEILNRFNGVVPSTSEELLSIKGIGRKTANLVLSQAFDIPAICVDIHVHRVSNRLGIINTKTVFETEKALERIIPKEKWNSLNYLFVTWGQNICVPISPFCSICVLAPICPKIGVAKMR